MTLHFTIRQILLQNATAILLQNATETYYKVRQFFITKCCSYYKMLCLLQVVTVQGAYIKYVGGEKVF